MNREQYKEALKDPRWDLVRLATLKRDKFTCKECNGTDKVLHVHHRRYIDGRMPWQYPLNFLITLCEDCHFKLHEENPSAGHEIVKKNRKNSRYKHKNIFYGKERITLFGGQGLLASNGKPIYY